MTRRPAYRSRSGSERSTPAPATGVLVAAAMIAGLALTSCSQATLSAHLNGRTTPETPAAVHVTHHQPREGTDERLQGVNTDVTLLFVGGAGELAFDTTTGTFTPESQHG